LADPPEIQIGNCTMLGWDASSTFEVRLYAELIRSVGNKEVCMTEFSNYVLEKIAGIVSFLPLLLFYE